MKKYKLLFYIFIFSYLSSFCQNAYLLDGKIDKVHNGKYVFMTLYHGYDEYKEDSTVIQDGKFYFEGESFLEGTAILRVEDDAEGEMALEFILEEGNIKIELSTDTIRRIKAGWMNDIFSNFLNNFWEDEMTGKLISENLSNPMGKILFMRGMYGLNESKISEIIEKKGDEYLCDSTIVRQLEYIKQRFELSNIRKASVGSAFSDIQLETSDGKFTSLSDLINTSEYTFINFWASWCKPCIAKIPDLKDLFYSNQENKFQIISITLDEDREDWLKALKKYDMPWQQFGLFEDILIKEIKEKYNFTSIPHSVLINKKGIICKINIDINEIKNTYCINAISEKSE